MKETLILSFYRSIVGLIFVLTCSILLTGIAQSQSAEGTPSAQFDREFEQVSTALIQSYVANVEVFAGTDANQQKALKQSFQRALQLFNEREKLIQQRTAAEQSIEQVPEQLKRIRSMLAQPPNQQVDSNFDGAKLTDLVDSEKALTKSLAEEQQQLKSLRALIHSLAERKAAAVKQVGDDRETIQNLEATLLKQNSEIQSPLVKAKRVVILVERSYLLVRIQLSETELKYDGARRDLIAAQIDLALRRVNQVESSLKAISPVIVKKRGEEAEKVKESSEKLKRLAARQHPLMQKVAEENLRLAELRTGKDNEGLAKTVASLAQQLVERRQGFTRLENRIKNARRKVRAAGLTNAIGLFLRRQLELLPNDEAIAGEISDRLQKISENQYQWFLYEDQREQYGDVAKQVQQLLAQLDEPLLAEQRLFLEAVAMELFQSRRKILDLILSDYQQYFETAVELNRIDAERIKLVRSFRSYVEERILWVPSIDEKSRFDIGVFAELGSLFHYSTWMATNWTILSGLWQNWFKAFGLLLAAIVVLAGTFYSRWQLRKPLTEEQSADPKITHVLRALLLAVVGASPAAFALFGAAWLWKIHGGPKDLAIRVVCDALFVAGLSLYFLGWIRELVRPGQIAHQHFSWPLECCSHTLRHQRWYIPVHVILVFIYALVDSHEVPPHWNDTIGRFAFIVNQLLTTAFVFCTLRFDRPVGRYFVNHADAGLLRQFRFLLLGAMILAPLFLAGLSIRGYHYTALRFEERLYSSSLLMLSVLVFYALSTRWLSITKHHHEKHLKHIAEAIEKSEAAPSSEPDIIESEEQARTINPLLMDPDSLKVTTAELTDEYESKVEQAQSFVRSLIWLTLLFGLLGIWSAMVPASRQFEQYQIYPEMKFISSENDQSGAESTKASWSTVDKPANTANTGSSAEADASAPSIRVTVADLLFALIVGGFAIGLASNLPALTDIALLRYLPIDSGGRYAISALTQYLILGIGISLALSSLGLRWRSVQWLAAALTFGLAFGLQEIFANFISGLIILFERPIRVGDVVTVGDTSGVVTRIQIRATTIRNFERKELIIPNKAFVTDRVLNWVLTDSVVRILIPIGVAYGTDVFKARQVLESVVNSHSKILKEPGPSVLFLGFGESALNFEIRGFVASPAVTLSVKNDLCVAVTEAFRHNEIEIAFPQLDIHLRDIPKDPKSTPGQVDSN